MNKDTENNNGNYDYADTDEPAAGANGNQTGINSNR